MSLNGLDDLKIKEAHGAAVAEPGGWFLLKYASRDEIELLGRGNGGIVEIRNAISEYDETSPLYGFLRYRRRNVLVKYLPEDCSRLIQVRVTVHLNAICERFSPYDTIFSIATATELRDTKLSAACSLHAASGSTSSSTSSIRRRRLGEIAEEDEEEQQRASKRQSVFEINTEIAVPELEYSSGLETSPPPPREEPPVTLNAELADSPDQGQFTTDTDPPDFTGADPPYPRKSFDTSGRRLSSQTTRAEFYNSYGRQKVKLGPRPSTDVSGRPRTAAGNSRAVSTVPAGFKLFSKGSRKGRSKDSNSDDASIAEEQSEVPEITLAAADTLIPPAPESPGIEEPRRPHTSSGASFVMPNFKITTPAKAKITPEKARLMKAMQLREKKKRLSMLPPPSPTASSDFAQEVVEETGAQGSQPAAGSSEEESTANHLAADADGADKDDAATASNADSAIVMEASTSTINDQASDATLSDSHPTSPVIASSEADQSTKASSVSESTDETVQAQDSVMVKDREEHVGIASGDAEETVTSAAPLEDHAEDDQLADTTFTDIDEKSVPRPTTADELSSEFSDHVDERVEPEIENTIQRRTHTIIPVSKFSTDIDEKPIPRPTTADELSSEFSDHVEHVEPETENTIQRRTNAVLPVSKFSTDHVYPTRDADDEAVVGTEPDPAPEPEVPEEPKILALRIPKSKFSTPDLRAAVETQEPTVPAIMAVDTQPGLDAVGEELAQEGDNGDSTSILRRVSRPASNLDPIRTDFTSDRSSQHLSDDEELLDELQSAVVQEALPMAVSKSPMSPAFRSVISGKEGASLSQSNRAVSQPTALRPTLLSPTDVTLPTGRSSSSGTSFLNRVPQQQQPSAPIVKKTNIGSSISQRIKALEKLSSSGDGEVRPPAPSTSFFSMRKPSSRKPSRSPSVIERATSFAHNSPPAGSCNGSPDTSRQRSRDRSSSLKNRLSMFEPGVSPPRGRTESVQVRARIVRDPAQRPSSAMERMDPNDLGTLDLKQSPLTVDHRRAEASYQMPESTPTPAPAPKDTIRERRMSKEMRRSESRDRHAATDRKTRRSSVSIVKDFIMDRRKSLTSPSVDNLTAPRPSTPSRSPSRPPSTHQTSSTFPRRLSISSRRSSVSKDTMMAPDAISPSAYTETSGSGDDARSTSGDKRNKGRAGRFMRRLSSSLGGRSKSTPTGISPTLHEEVSSEAVAAAAAAAAAASESSGPTVAAYMGDVNVQFPDNLLWKRRCMSLDSQGFLVLGTVSATAAALPGAGVKRYHLSEFRTPYTPGMDVQELPNSVVLDFVEGSGLQIACEDRAGQMSVLHTLQDAHRNHSSFGQ